MSSRTTSQSPAHSTPQPTSHPTPSGGLMEHPAAALRRAQAAPDRVTAQDVLQLQRTIGNRAVNALLVQRTFKVPSGAEYDDTSVKEGDPAAVAQIKREPQPFLLQSEAALERLEGGNTDGVRILPPAKHLIGEKHSGSKFQQAINDWGWGAARMVETLSTHPVLKERRGPRKARKDPNRPEYQALPLENTVVKELANLNYTEYLIINLTGWRSKWKDLSSKDKNDVIELYVPLLKEKMGTLDQLKETLLKYKKSSKSDYGKDEISILEKIKGKSELFREVESNLTDVWMGKNRNSIFQGMGQLRTVVNAMIDVCQAIIQGDDGQLYTDMDMDTRRQEFGESPTDPMNPLREHYMAQNIRNLLTVPGLVKVGKHHVPRLAMLDIPDARFHNNYTAFENATQAASVLADYGSQPEDESSSIDLDEYLARLSGDNKQ